MNTSPPATESGGVSLGPDEILKLTRTIHSTDDDDDYDASTNARKSSSSSAGEDEGNSRKWTATNAKDEAKKMTKHDAGTVHALNQKKRLDPFLVTDSPSAAAVAASTRTEVTKHNRSSIDISTSANYNTSDVVVPGAVAVGLNGGGCTVRSLAQDVEEGGGGGSSALTEPQTWSGDLSDVSLFTIVALAEEVTENQDAAEEWKQRASELQRAMDNAPRAQVLAQREHCKQVRNQRGCCTKCRLCLGIALVILIVCVTAVASGFKLRMEHGEESKAMASKTVEEDFIFPITSAAPSPLPPTLEAIQKRGYVKCRAGPKELARGHGFGLAMCEAIAAAVLGDANRTQFVPMAFREAFQAVANGTVDVATSLTIRTMEREIYAADHGVMFTDPFLYSGTVFAGVPEFVECAERGDTLVGNCRNLAVCVVEASLQETLVKSLLDGSIVHSVEATADMFTCLSGGRCNVLFSSAMLVPENTARDHNYTGPYVFSHKLYNRIPIAMFTRNDDAKFGDLVNWILRALIAAEPLKVTQTNALDFPPSRLGQPYDGMIQRAIAAAGNYGDLYNRSWQKELPRLLVNRPHLQESDGGLLYPYPLGAIDLESTNALPQPTINGTLETIEQRGALKCGILVSDRQGLAEWNETLGAYTGLDVDYCKGLAAACFAGQVSSSLVLVAYSSLEDAFVGLVSRDVDVLAGVEYNMMNDIQEPSTGEGFAFSDAYYYQQEVGGAPAKPLAMATRENDAQWTDFVTLISIIPIHAEERGIKAEQAADIPRLELFGPRYRQALRDVILLIGNYAEMYKRNLEHLIPRTTNLRNTLNSGSNPIFFTSESLF